MSSSSNKWSICLGFSSTQILFLLIIFSLLASIPLFTFGSSLPAGHDLRFHLVRILGIAQGLSAGQIPVRIQGVQIAGYGYPISIYYGDILLYPFALLHIAGISLKNCYQLLVICINITCTYISFYSFSKVFSSKRIGLIAAIIWTFSPYRLECVYLRAALGESISLSLYPALFYGIYSLFFFQEKEASKFGWAWCGVTFSLIISTHILSTFICLIVIVPIVLILLINHHKKEVLYGLFKAAGICIGLSLWFVIPFLDYFCQRGSEVISQAENTLAKATRHPIHLRQFFYFFSTIGGWSEAIGNKLDVINEMPFTMGITLTSMLILWPISFFLERIKYPQKVEKNTSNSFAWIFFFATMALLFIASTLYPWGASNSFARLINTTLSSVQFPWRFLGPASFFALILVAFVFKKLQKANNIHLKFSFLLLILLSFSEGIFGLGTYQAFAQRNSFFTIPDFSARSLCSSTYYGIFDDKYIPVGSSGKDFGKNVIMEPVILSGSGRIINWEKNDTQLKLHISKNKNMTEIRLPMFWYPYYSAKDVLTGKKLTLRNGQDNAMILLVPNNGSGNYIINFTEPIHWRISEVISIICLCIIIWKYLNKADKQLIEIA
ncbi:hypothetical protein [Olegusella massiliensis]|uniref:hypothetical protein n=1 Tax=Olegusella massiliensis TaxID=1776381 RepID=UPI000838EC24|nr:hypothetical protein [Olegusella massiliensis]